MNINLNSTAGRQPLLGTPRVAVGAKVLADLAAESVDPLDDPEPVVGEDKDLAGGEGEVVGGLADVDLAEEDAVGVPDVDAVAAAGPDVAVGVGVHAVGEAVVGEGEEAPVGEPLAAADDVVGVDGGRAGEVGVVALGARVGDVERLVVRGELDAVGLVEVVGDGLDEAGGGLEAVDLARELGVAAEVLEQAVLGVGEPEVAGDGVLPHVVDGAEVAAVEADDERLRLVGVDVDGEQLRVGLEVALVAPDLHRRRGGLVGAGRVVRRAAVGLGEVRELGAADGEVVEGDDGDVDVVLEGAVVGRDVQRVVLLVVDAALVEGLPVQVGDLAGRGVGADDVDEGGLVREQRDGGRAEVGGVDGGEVARAARRQGVEVDVDERHARGLEPEGNLLDGGEDLEATAGETDAVKELGEAVARAGRR
ncbi:hypothetical protein CGRA01v4_04380 [Colletotrichum graminicola]|nr:hypothetical protein CGRA01v4_04380 [Colletotrichum graminicola]